VQVCTAAGGVSWTYLTSEGVRPNDGKTKVVKEFPRPTTVKEVKSFLGLVNYYRRHLKNLAIVARPLTALTRNESSS